MTVHSYMQVYTVVKHRCRTGPTGSAETEPTRQQLITEKWKLLTGTGKTQDHVLCS